MNDNTKIEKSKFIINDIKLIGSWSYILNSNTDCTICRCSLNTNSIYNQEKDIDSYISTGICGHMFHQECIDPWVNKNKRCPLCSNTWQLKK